MRPVELECNHKTLHISLRSFGQLDITGLNWHNAKLRLTNKNRGVKFMYSDDTTIMQGLKIGERIRMVRTKKLGLQQGALGARIGVSANAVSKWERDLNSLEPEHLEMLSKVTEVDRSWYTDMFVHSMPERGREIIQMLTMLPASDQMEYYEIIEMLLLRRFERDRRMQERMAKSA